MCKATKAEANTQDKNRLDLSVTPGVGIRSGLAGIGPFDRLPSCPAPAFYPSDYGDGILKDQETTGAGGP